MNPRYYRYGGWGLVGLAAIVIGGCFYFFWPTGSDSKKPTTQIASIAPTPQKPAHIAPVKPKVDVPKPQVAVGQPKPVAATPVVPPALTFHIDSVTVNVDGKVNGAPPASPPSINLTQKGGNTNIDTRPSTTVTMDPHQQTNVAPPQPPVPPPAPVPAGGARTGELVLTQADINARLTTKTGCKVKSFETTPAGIHAVLTAGCI